MRTSMRTWWSVAAVAGLGWAMAPAPASACGGFFCQREPMNQAGENILFSVEGDGTLTAHVQILYSGAADAFAWILPLPSVPTSIGVGTDALFEQLGVRTAPRFESQSRIEGTCRAEPSCPYGPEYDSSPGPVAGGGSADAGVASPPPDVTVYLREAVGPYDAVVLGAASAADLFTWLDTNGYDIPDVSRPIVAEYVAARHVFVAIRLLTGVDTQEIQPLVLRYAEAQPCVPMRLTAIATIDDMPITAYFAGASYATSNNYSMLEPSYDETRLWGEGGSYGGGYYGGPGPGAPPGGPGGGFYGGPSAYYSTYVSNLVDDAGGRAFVTEFAGAMPAVDSLTLPDVTDLASVTDPGTFLRSIRERGFSGDAQLLGILTRFLPVPAGSAYEGSPSGYMNCLWGSGSGGAECGYTGGFDPAALVDALQRQIVGPRREAQDVLERHPRLTRLYTTMSAADMTVDPTFTLDTGLPEVSNVHTATVVTECSASYFEWSAPQHIELPSGRSAPWRDGVTYLGSDEEYCMDRGAGTFSPWASADTLRETSSSRSVRPTGGGLRCAVGPATRSTGLVGMIALGASLAMAFVRRRRR